MGMRTSIIATVSQNSVVRIADDWRWPHLERDLERFRRHTRGHVVIVGRGTYEALLLLNDQLLKDCVVIVLSRNPDYKANGHAVAPSLERARERARELTRKRRSPMVVVIGGEEAIWQAVSWADHIIITVANIYIYIGHDGAHFPPLPPTPKDAWELVRVEIHEPDKGDPLSYVTYEYRRKGMR